MTDERPTVIAGRYRLMNRIGSGGMGHVWLAWDERLNRAVAVKQLHSPVGLPEAEARVAHDRAMREARITARLHHPNAVPVFDVVDHEGQPCLVMQYLPSRSLQAVLTERGPLPAREAARIGSELAAALAAAHRADIVHRDVKPGNVLLADDGTARITDFGISHALGDASLTSTGMVTGTPAYLAPEVARGTSSSAASDVFSLGATLYAAVEGAPPFGTGENAMALLHRVASGAITPPSDGPLTPVLLAMLAAAPEDRPAMQEVSEVLAEVAAGRAPRGVMGASSEDGQVRTRVLPAAGAAAGVGAAGAAGAAAGAGTAPSTASTSRLTPTAAPRTVAAAVADPTDPTEAAERLPGARRAGGTAYSGPGATPPPAPPVARDGAPARRRRLVLLVGVVALVGIGLLVWALSGSDTGSGQPAPPVVAPTTSNAIPRPSTPAPTTSRAATPSASTSAPASSATTAPTTAGTPVTPPAGTSAADLERAVRDYYALLPGNTDAGWARLTDRYRTTTSGNRATYDRFWTSVDTVDVLQATGSAPGSVVATLRYAFTDGRRYEERTSYALVDDGGVLKIDRSSVLSSRRL